jgi:hypothetical protein
MKDLTQTERGKTISFFNELDTETRTMLVISVSFFNEVVTETQKLSSVNPGSIPRPLFHFLTRLPQRRKNYPQNLVSFFNEVAKTIQRCKNYPRKLSS